MLEVDCRLQFGAFSLDARFVCPTPGVTALFGPSGAGKTTIVNAIAGLVAPASGCIRLDGTTLFDRTAGIDVPAERRRVGYVFQDARLFPHLDVAGNLSYGARRAPAGVRYANRGAVVELLGLGTLLARRVHQLSGGERQRVALARALLAQPQLLLLDEPLAGVDAARRDEVLPYLETLRDHYAVPMLYVSHHYDEVLRLANHVVLLAQGGVLAAGTAPELSLNPALRALVGSEAVGAVIDADVVAVEPATALVSVALGAATLRFALPGALPAGRVRLNVLARDVILATAQPHGLSVRNVLPGTLTELSAEGLHSVLATVAVDGATLLARITPAAVADLGLRPGLPVWALIKAASLRGRAFSRHDPAPAPGLALRPPVSDA